MLWAELTDHPTIEPHVRMDIGGTRSDGNDDVDTDEEEEEEDDI